MNIVILDRDGVINFDSKDYIKSPEEWHPIPGSLEAVSILNKKGYRVAVATNQSGLARGLYQEKTLIQIHQKMHLELKKIGGYIDHIFHCPHGPYDNCDCRKPKPGLLHQIAKYYGISLNQIPFVGDSIRDIMAAKVAGAKPILVLSGNGKHTQEKYAEQLSHIPCFTDLLDFAENYADI